MLLTSIAAGRAGTERIVPLVSSLGYLALDPAGRTTPRPALDHAPRLQGQPRGRVPQSRRCRPPEKRGLIAAETPVHVVPGAGVDLTRFTALPMPQSTRPRVPDDRPARAHQGRRSSSARPPGGRARTPHAASFWPDCPAAPADRPARPRQATASVELAARGEDVRALMATPMSSCCRPGPRACRRQCSRRWPAAGRSSPPTCPAAATPSTSASTACWCRRDAARWPLRSRAQQPARAARLDGAREPAQAERRFDANAVNRGLSTSWISIGPIPRLRTNISHQQTLE